MLEIYLSARKFLKVDKEKEDSEGLRVGECNKLLWQLILLAGAWSKATVPIKSSVGSFTSRRPSRIESNAREQDSISAVNDCRYDEMMSSRSLSVELSRKFCESVSLFSSDRILFIIDLYFVTNGFIIGRS